MSNFTESMAANFARWYDDFWQKRDKRVDDWPTMSSPLPMFTLIALYCSIALKLGPAIMRNRAPFELRKTVVFYNICMILFNAYILHQGWRLTWGNDYSWTCQPLDRSTNPRSLKIAGLVWLYYVCKYLDWLDTLFFILKKKFNHLSGLHIYHHTVMPYLGWCATRFMPGGHVIFGGLLNCIVHVIMHFYYCVSAMGPRYQKYLWWKKYLTTLQMLQFVVSILHALQAMYLYDCGIDLPIEWAYSFICHPLIFFILFARFYKKTYVKKDKAN